MLHLARCGFDSRLRPSVKRSAALVATSLVLAVAVAVAGCGGGDDAEQAPQGRPAPKVVEAIAVEGGSRDERALLRGVVGGMEKTTLTRIAIGAPEARRKTDGAKAMAITFTAVPGVTTRRQWDEWIVAGAFSRRLSAAGLPAVVDAGDDRGGFTARPKLSGQPDPQPLPAEREKAIVRGIRNAAKSSGAAVVGLEVHRPYAAAVVLTIAPEDSASFLKTKLRPLLRKLDVYRPRLEGIYLAVLDEQRRLAMEWGSWTRNRAGSYWVRRDLSNCSPIRQSEPPGTEPAPPCPA